jgi:ArsR family transcriptional regulator, arsenate/arsenite/antimonite-responsive transcriptional repressor
MSLPVDDQAVTALRALAHPVRLGIMQELARHPETCACDFTEVFAVAQPTVSAHLRTLREADLVTIRKRGTQICYSIAPKPSSASRPSSPGSRPRSSRRQGDVICGRLRLGQAPGGQ